VHRALAKVLELPAARIRVIACPNGAALAEEDPFSHEIVAAKLAMLTGRPGEDHAHARGGVLYCHAGAIPRSCG